MSSLTPFQLLLPLHSSLIRPPMSSTLLSMTSFASYPNWRTISGLSITFICHLRHPATCLLTSHLRQTEGISSIYGWDHPIRTAQHTQIPITTVTVRHFIPWPFAALRFPCSAGQVAGRKLLWVAPPRASAHMYPFGAEVENEEPQEDEKRSGLQEQYMGNTTQVDVLATCEQNQDQLADQRHRFPRFFAHALPLSQQAILEPGDMLFLPPGWWHALKSLDSAVSVSLWF